METLEEGHRRVRRGSATGALLVLLAALGAGLLGGCAAPGSDVHLAPLYTRLRTAGGGTATEMLGGLWTAARKPGKDAVTVRGLRPLWSRFEYDDGRVSMYFVAPLGFYTRKGQNATSFFFPLYYWQAYTAPDGSRPWDLVALPGILWSHREFEDDAFGWFPVFGSFSNFLTFDRIEFILFPLYLKTLREGTTSWSLLFPVFNWAAGPAISRFRIWPFYGRSRFHGRYDRTFVLWPFFHLHRNHLGGGGEQPETKWLLFPFYGQTRRGPYRSHTVLWPFFGWATDERGDFWAVDAPWPLVRLQGGGVNPLAEKRTRVWPFYSHYESTGLVAKSYAWPLVQRRSESYSYATRESLYVLPFLQSWTRVDERTGEESSWLRLWPIYQEYREGDDARTSFPTLNPLWRSPFIDFHYGWLWELYAVEESEHGGSHRSWLGLFRREVDAEEDRSSFAGLWASRGYSEGGDEVTETSLLFGLLRWRKITDGAFRFLAPAFPGPGWPALPDTGPSPGPADESDPAASDAAP